MTQDSTKEITFSRELIVNLWQHRATVSNEKQFANITPIIAQYVFCKEDDLLETLEFFNSEISTAIKQIKEKQNTI